MNEDNWQRARLIPTTGIGDVGEQERRATSALLAVLAAVEDFGRAVTQPLGAPVGAIETFVEVPFTSEGSRCSADGVVRVRSDQRTWTALVEVTTGSTGLDAGRVRTCLDIARARCFDAVLTVSNDIQGIAGQHPLALDKRTLQGVGLFHYSWSHLLAAAVVHKEHRAGGADQHRAGGADQHRAGDADQHRAGGPDERRAGGPGGHRAGGDPYRGWVLTELIRYLEHPRSGALEFDDMGAFWAPVREAVTTGTLRPVDEGVLDVTGRFDALLRHASLRLGRQLGTDVVPLLSQREVADPCLRTHALREALAGEGTLTGVIRIPDAIAPVVVTADLRAGRVTCHVDVEAPREGEPVARVEWLVRQLAAAPDTTRIEASVAHGRGMSTAGLLRSVRTAPAALVSDPRRQIRGFRVALDQALGTDRGRGRGSFIDSVLSAIDVFYTDVVHDLTAWTAPDPDGAGRAATGTASPPAVAMTVIDVRDPVALPSMRPPTPDGSAPRTPPALPSRREVRVVRQLGADDGGVQPEGLQHEAGWYQDPQDATQLRWWDGTSWSGQTYPAQPALA